MSFKIDHVSIKNKSFHTLHNADYVYLYLKTMIVSPKTIEYVFGEINRSHFENDTESAKVRKFALLKRDYKGVSPFQIVLAFQHDNSYQILFSIFRPDYSDKDPLICDHITFSTTYSSKYGERDGMPNPPSRMPINLKEYLHIESSNASSSSTSSKNPSSDRKE